MYTSKLHQLRTLYFTIFERYTARYILQHNPVQVILHLSLFGLITLMKQNCNRIVTGNAFYLEEHKYLQPMLHSLDEWHRAKNISKKILPQYSEVANNKETRYSNYWPSKIAGKYDCPEIWYQREWTYKPYFLRECMVPKMAKIFK